MPTATVGRINSKLDFNLEKVLFHLFIFTSLFLLIDPFYFGYGAFRVTRDLGPFKYFGLMFGVAALFFGLIGLTISIPRSEQPPWRKSIASGWPIMAFGLLVTGGSMWARFHFNIKETFLQLGIGIAGFPIAVILFWCIDAHMLVARRFLQGLIFVFPIVIGWVIFKRIEGGQAFHTELYLFVPLAVYFFISLARRWLAWSILLSTVVLAIANHKNTAYFVLLITLIHLLLISVRPYIIRAVSFRRILIIYVLSVLFLICIAIIAFLLINRDELLPSGNLDVRAMTYRAAIFRFLDSPIYGTGFTASVLVQLRGLSVLGNNSLETHSDMLDILSHGGLIGATLFIFGITIAFFRAMAVLRYPVADDVKAIVHGLGTIVICGLFTSCFNTPLLNLPNGLLFWFAFGLLVAVADYGRFLLSKQHGNVTGDDACHK